MKEGEEDDTEEGRQEGIWDRKGGRNVIDHREREEDSS
jgi:hypothetical protein